MTTGRGEKSLPFLQRQAHLFGVQHVLLPILDATLTKL
jgi:hypothetical protein